MRPRTGYGQNFLIDLNLLDVLVEAAELSPGDVVLEVGTGTGGLTALMAPHVAAVVTVEIDRRLFQLADEELHGLTNVTRLCTDALRTKNCLNSEVLAAVDAQLSSGEIPKGGQSHFLCEKIGTVPNRCFKLVANLPYQVATPILTNLLALPRPPRRMAVTIQKEVADRLVARPGSKDYGALSVWVQCQCRAEVLRILPPSVFWPRPKVFSAFVRLDFDDRRRAEVGDYVFFHDFVRRLFLHRRKYLRAQLLSAAREHLDKSDVDGLLARLGLDPALRAEQLDVETLLRLGKELQILSKGLSESKDQPEQSEGSAPQ
ncbi:MAG: ribosomal RNA small subunit methyltransferase A [Pirellulales bacterium]|nr:ribosomal RNA small subunit methyltransferase A [Pirellulales bacterium]